MRRGTIHNATEMMNLIQEVGFLPLLYSGISGFSADEVVDSDCRYSVYDDGWDWPMWKWKGPIVTEGGCVYGKFFDKKAGYISMDWWPDFYNWRRHAYPALSRLHRRDHRDDIARARQPHHAGAACRLRLYWSKNAQPL